eukprot:snap_masked-scaffold_18-processed-gene-4.13-mRNA-1 protein AED:1.00 eAED:1.00 QI:0/-1/0/0/-1/1/1/0/60
MSRMSALLKKPSLRVNTEDFTEYASRSYEKGSRHFINQKKKEQVTQKGKEPVQENNEEFH